MRTRYRSNITCPDLSPAFPHATELPYDNGPRHVVVGDQTLWDRCGYTSHDEAAILYNVATMARGLWTEIGAHTGWSTAHLAHPGNTVLALEPEFHRVLYNITGKPQLFADRFFENIAAALGLGSVHPDFFATPHDLAVAVTGQVRSFVVPSYHFSWHCLPQLAAANIMLNGAFIDGDHAPPCPLVDAMLVAPMLAEDSIVVFHDAISSPIVAGINWLRDWLLSAGRLVEVKRYNTPQLLTAIATGRYAGKLPVHVPDPSYNWESYCAETDVAASASLAKDYNSWVQDAESRLKNVSAASWPT